MRRGARDYLVKDSDGRYLDFLAGAIDRLLREQRLIDEKLQAERVLRQSQKELRELAAYQEKLKEHERTRIAQEIHDELGGLLTGIKAYISVAIERGGEQADPLLKDAAKLAQDAIETVRRVITDLRPSVLDQLGIWPALEWYADQVAQRSGLRCSCHITADALALELDAERSTMLFRVAQEALTNVVRHADASEARLLVGRDGDYVVLRVEDNGKGIESAGLSDRESWGLFGMHERTRRFAGELNISGKAGQGTTLQLRLPLEDKNG
jgi:signal transduction histidine kinase